MITIKTKKAVFRTRKFICLLLGLFCSCENPKLPAYNFTFEKISALSIPNGLENSFFNQHLGYKCSLDSQIRKNGKYSVLLKSIDEVIPPNFGQCQMRISPPSKSGVLRFTIYIRTQKASRATLFINLEDNSGASILTRETTVKQGETDLHWKLCTLEIPYDRRWVKNIYIGTRLYGKGCLWMDEINLSIDGQSVESIGLAIQHKAEEDCIFNKKSPIDTVALDSGRIARLSVLCQLWGFLKYYHPAIAQGKYNWDAELFRILPLVISADKKEEYYSILEQWIDRLGRPSPCNNCSQIPLSQIFYQTNFGDLNKKGVLPTPLRKKIDYIRENYNPKQTHYYVTSKLNAPVFTNENKYDDFAYPDVGIRLLGLFSYWSKINYYYPYRYQLGNWPHILSYFISKFVQAKDKYEYTGIWLRLLSYIKDSHSGIWGYNATLSKLKGLWFAPFDASFVEGKLLVTGKVFNSESAKLLRAGDVIEQIDGKKVHDLVEKYLPYTPGSNRNAQLTELCSFVGSLLRSNNSVMHLVIRRSGLLKHLKLKKIYQFRTNQLFLVNDSLNQSGYKLLDRSIGYIRAAGLAEDDFAKIPELFRGTKGVIIDLRGYPTVNMLSEYANWFKRHDSVFTLGIYSSLRKPGSAVYGATISSGTNKYLNRNGHLTYQGRVIILVNANTLSNGEFTALSLSASKNATVVGDQTAGAVGDVSNIFIPGGINTRMTGIAFCYPDSSQTKPNGVKVDVYVQPTLKDIINKRDPLLTKAIELIKLNL